MMINISIILGIINMALCGVLMIVCYKAWNSHNININDLKKDMSTLLSIHEVNCVKGNESHRKLCTIYSHELPTVNIHQHNKTLTNVTLQEVVNNLYNHKTIKRRVKCEEELTIIEPYKVEKK